MSPREQLEFLRADLGAVRKLRGELDADDALGRVSMDARERRLLKEIAHLETQVGKVAEVSIAVGRHDIENLVTVGAKYRDLTRAISPDAASDLRVVAVRDGVVHLAEPDTQVHMLPSAAVAAAQAVAGLVRALAGDDDDASAEALDGFSPDAIKAATDLLNTIREIGAGLDFRVGDTALAVGADGITKAWDRTRSQRDVKDGVRLRGRFAGLFTESRRYEFKLDSGEVLRGNIDRSRNVHQWAPLLDQECEGVFRVTTTRREGVPPKSTHLLTDLAEAARTAHSPGRA